MEIFESASLILSFVPHFSSLSPIKVQTPLPWPSQGQAAAMLWASHDLQMNQ